MSAYQFEECVCVHVHVHAGYLEIVLFEFNLKDITLSHRGSWEVGGSVVGIENLLYILMEM